VHRALPYLTPPLLIGTVAAVLGGCNAGPDFVHPSGPTTFAYTGKEEGTKLAPGSGEVSQHFVMGKKIAQDWWTLFKTPVFDDVVKQAIGGSRTLVAAQANLRQARDEIAVAAGAQYPQFAFNAGASRERTNLSSEGINVPPNQFNLYSLGPSVSFALDPFGGNRRHVEQETVLAEAQDYQLDASLSDLDRKRTHATGQHRVRPRPDQSAAGHYR
jgi:outer membrane protein TolC